MNILNGTLGDTLSNTLGDIWSDVLSGTLSGAQGALPQHLLSHFLDCLRRANKADVFRFYLLLSEPSLWLVSSSNKRVPDLLPFREILFLFILIPVLSFLNRLLSKARFLLLFISSTL